MEISLSALYEKNKHKNNLTKWLQIISITALTNKCPASSKTLICQCILGQMSIMHPAALTVLNLFHASGFELLIIR